MRLFIRTILAIALVAAGASCAHKMPLVSHAHIGHSVDYWHDTPDNMGLYKVADLEIKSAIQSANQALAAGLSERQRRGQLAAALHALDPDRQASGPGLGYGAVRAWGGAVDHLEYAATSDDASENLVTTIAVLAAIGDDIGRRLAQTAERAAAVLSDTEIDAEVVAFNVRRDLLDLYLGHDADEDGVISVNVNEAGVLQISEELSRMLGREIDPDYEPLPRRYVLGLVRLPSGKWGFRLPRSRAVSYGY